VKNGTVTVRVAPVSGKSYVAVQVQDTGIGMPEGTVQRAGTKFFRAENAMKANVDGVGLGLYIVRNIVRRHGGELWVESKLDRGTTVTFTLPTSPALIPPKEFSNEE
jgi:signal transduction histidine kinase